MHPGTTTIRARHKAGMTLLELTVVILTLLGLVSVLFIGARSFKRGADRSTCLLNLQNVQKAVRGYANCHGCSPGQEVEGLSGKIISPTGYLRHLPTCRGGGTYTLGEDGGENRIPGVGQLYMECSLGGSHDHQLPENIPW